MRATIDANAFPVADGRLVTDDIALPVRPSLPSGEIFALALEHQTAVGDLLKGRSSGGSKSRSPFLPV